MHSKLRIPLWGIIEAILILILIVTITCMSVHNKNKYTEWEELNNSLSITIDEQAGIIQTLKKENTSLNNDVSQLQKDKEQLEQEYEKLQEDNVTLQEENKNLQEENKKLQTATTLPSSKDFKSYMPYTAITNTSSKQWKLQQFASTDINGIRCIDGRPMVAVGTGWGCYVGSIILVTCENGNSFEAVVGDIKSDRHTDADNKTTISNNCRCEFIIDLQVLDPKVRSSGNMATLKQYSGYVINIQKIGEVAY